MVTMNDVGLIMLYIFLFGVVVLIARAVRNRKK